MWGGGLRQGAGASGPGGRCTGPGRPAGGARAAAAPDHGPAAPGGPAPARRTGNGGGPSPPCAPHHHSPPLPTSMNRDRCRRPLSLKATVGTRGAATGAGADPRCVGSVLLASPRRSCDPGIRRKVVRQLWQDPAPWKRGWGTPKLEAGCGGGGGGGEPGGPRVQVGLDVGTAALADEHHGQLATSRRALGLCGHPVMRATKVQQLFGPLGRNPSCMPTPRVASSRGSHENWGNGHGDRQRGCKRGTGVHRMVL